MDGCGCKPKESVSPNSDLRRMDALLRETPG
jgi:hypothetical protein